MVRRIVAPALAAVTLVSAAAAPAGARSEHHLQATARATSAMRVLETQVLVNVNRIRAQHRLVGLRFSPRLTAAATQHSREMARLGYFSHDSADGSAFWRRIESYYPSRGFRKWSVGENLLWSSPDVDAAGALRMWMQSPEHRANLLNRGWREVGLSAIHVASAHGAYHDLDVTIVTADFGARQR